MNQQVTEIVNAELDDIRAAPNEAVGFGDKAYMPYYVNGADALMSVDDPSVTRTLLAEAQSTQDRVYRLAVLHVLGHRTDPTVDDALITALGDPDLRATSAYLLGRRGFTGYRTPPRDDQHIREALRNYLDDESTFDDPFYDRRFQTQDFVLGAFVRLAGPENFQIADTDLADLIGYSLPRLTDAVRASLLKQATATTSFK
jgi:hypothetical protein